MSIDQEIFEDLKEYASQRYEGFEVIPKEDSLFMRFLAVLLFFNSRFLSGYVTTIGAKVYIPKARITLFPWETLAHEIVHIADSFDAKLGRFMWGFLYLCPQILGAPLLLSLSAFPLWSWTPLWWLVFGVFALPWPAYWRMRSEKRGYAMSMAARYWFTGEVSPGLRQHVFKKFLGWDYYKMWPFQKSLSKWADGVEAQLKSGELRGNMGEVFEDVYQILEKRGALHG